jgi:hypothetical protein
MSTKRHFLSSTIQLSCAAIALCVLCAPGALAQTAPNQPVATPTASTSSTTAEPVASSSAAAAASQSETVAVSSAPKSKRHSFLSWLSKLSSGDESNTDSERPERTLLNGVHEYVDNRQFIPDYDPSEFIFGPGGFGR